MTADHLDGTNHWFEFVQLVNQMFDGTSVIRADALVMCHRCGTWKVVPQEAYSLTGGAR